MDTIEEALQWSQIVGTLNAVFFRGALDAKFDEKKVKRGGNPDNSGQFSEQGGSGSKAEEKPAKKEKKAAAKPKEKTPKASAKKHIDDIGEKIGGARKDFATKTGPRKPKITSEETVKVPEWEKRYIALQSRYSGKWALQDTKSGIGRTLPMQFETEAEANAARPLAAVARNHTAYPDREGNYEIWRKVTDRKRVKVVPDKFSSRDAALSYMANNAEKILNTKTGFGEEILAKPEKVYRNGEPVRKGDVDPNVFKDELKWRGVEFGNWQGDRQQVLNHAYDAIHDLGEALGLHPADLSLKGELGLAFGARGHGIHGARAHYEPEYAAMNLTKVQGAGALAHEWAHALDHYLGRLDEPRHAEMGQNVEGHRIFKNTEDDVFASNRLSNRRPGKLQEGVRQAYSDLMSAMVHKPVQFTEDTEKSKKFVSEAQSQLDRSLDGIRKGLTEKLTWGKRNVNPATAEQLKRFDAAAAKLKAGEDLETSWKSTAGEGKSAKARGGMAGRRTNEALEALSKVYKEVRGRAGFDSTNQSGIFDHVRSEMGYLSTRKKMLADAEAQSVKTRMAPTDYAMEAKRADEGRVSDYWQQKHEMMARSLSSYVEDKLAAKGHRSDYLSFGSDNKYYKLQRLKPFPEGDERTVINGKMDNFLRSLREAKIMREHPGAKKATAKKPKAPAKPKATKAKKS